MRKIVKNTVKTQKTIRNVPNRREANNTLTGPEVVKIRFHALTTAPKTILMATAKNTPANMVTSQDQEDALTKHHVLNFVQKTTQVRNVPSMQINMAVVLTDRQGAKIKTLAALTAKSITKILSAKK